MTENDVNPPINNELWKKEMNLSITPRKYHDNKRLLQHTWKYVITSQMTILSTDID